MPAPPPSAWTAQALRARNQLFGAFFFAVFLFLLYQLYQVFSPFLAPMIWAVILALATYPAYDALLERFQGRTTLAALAMTVLITAAIVIPTVSLSSVVSRESVSLYGHVTDMVRSGRVNRMVEDLRQSGPGRWVESIDRRLEIDWPQIVQRIADAMSSQVTAFARNVAVFLLDLLLMLFTIFFVFRDGSAMQRTLRDLIPMDAEHKDAVFHRLYETLSAVMRGMLATALVQGILTGLGLYVLGVPYAAFLGVVAGMFALIPLVGPGVVWLPAAIYLWVIGESVRATILVVYGTFAIGAVDNFVRPLLIGGAARLPTLFLFFGMLGGLQVYGFLGIFLGPVLLAIVMAFVDIYREEYAGPADEPPPLAG
jgi:predicted PurR-regulated permease PerM